MRYLLILSLFVILVSCNTNPPNEPENKVEFGKLLITSNIDSSKIFVDNYFTGKYTPDTVDVTVGKHLIKLEKFGFVSAEKEVIVLKDSLIEIKIDLVKESVSRVVLLEDFANVSCTPCVTSNKIIESLTNNTFDKSKLVVIKYPTNFPSPNDPFYLANKNDCDARITYYNVFLAPTIIVNGTQKPTPSDSNDIKQKINTQLSTPPKFDILASDSIIGDVLKINISAEVLDTTGINFSDLVLHTAVIETEIEFATPPGSNGETKFFNVMRLMSPTSSGESLNNFNPMIKNNYYREININPSWQKNKLATIVFIQNRKTKEVYQSTLAN